MLRCWADYGSGQRPDMAEVLVFINTESAKAREQEGAQETLIDFTGLLQRESQFPSAGGGFADIWKALWQRESTTYKVRHLKTPTFRSCLSCAGCCKGIAASCRWRGSSKQDEQGGFISFLCLYVH